MRTEKTNKEGFEWDDPELLNKLSNLFENKLLAFSGLLSNPLEYIKYAEDFIESNGFHALRDIGLTWAWLGNYERSIDVFEQLIALPVTEHGIKWQSEIKEEAEFIVSLYSSQGSGAMDEQLKNWTTTTISDLKLSKFVGDDC